jgi:hypothetical protein
MKYVSKDEDSRKLKKIERQETDEATSSGSSGAFEGPLFGGETDFAGNSLTFEAQFKAVARALRDAVSLDGGIAGVPSTKGSL